MKEIIIGRNEEDKRLDRFLNSYLKDASMGFIYKMLRKKNITLNDKKADGTEKLSTGDIIKIYFSDETFDKFRGTEPDKGTNAENSHKITDELGKLPVIYEDENIVLVNKPAGILSQKAAKEDISLNEWLIEYLLNNGSLTKESLETYRPSICNRLDRNTSGLVICAKSLSGARILNALIKNRDIDKYYMTVVSGKLEDNITLKGYLRKDERENKVYIRENDPHDTAYSYIETAYKPVRYLEKQDMTLLEVKLITGKPHQIRAHLASINHPIIGDAKYGGRVIPNIKYQLLHSYRIVFPDIDGSKFENISNKEFVAELPDLFSIILGDMISDFSH